MHYKSLLSLALLAIASVKADKDSSRTQCLKKNGMFLENPSDVTDERYACFLPASNYSDKTKYFCGTTNDFYGCYEKTLGNMSYCDKSSKEFNSKGCHLGTDYLSNMIYFERQRHQEAKDNCKIEGGQFFEAISPNDFRYACFLPRSSFSNTSNLFCGGYDGFEGCYAKQYGNMNYCDKSSKEFHSRGCALGVGYLQTETRNADLEKKQKSKKTCQQKHGIWFANEEESNDNRFACFLPRSSLGNSNNLFCGSYNGYSGCYAKDLGNMDYCDMSSKQFNSRGCALSMYYLSEMLVKY